MDAQIKAIFKNSIITSIVILIYGLVVQEKAVYIGLVSGCILSIFQLYLIYRDTKIAIYSGKSAAKIAFAGYLKRYALSFILLFLMLKLDFACFAGAVIGLLLSKLMIFTNLIKKQIIKIKNNFLGKEVKF